ncbi:hypothetical protein [Paracoccus litorisediminis]|nr:hypothetical protein [Paracoccus litorisediminis]
MTLWVANLATLYSLDNWSGQMIRVILQSALVATLPTYLSYRQIVAS